MKSKEKFLVFLGVLILIVPIFVLAEDGRSYFYESISQKFTVNEDTTVGVEETQIYNFTGEYHKGWRSIPLDKVSDITDVSVLDGATLKPLQYVSRPLEKTDPNSWGKYTYRKNGGNLEIEWYYNANNELRTWILKYKLIGALSFLKDKDELYWDLFTDYEVPVDFVSAIVTIPGNTYSPSDLSSYIYRTNVGLDGSGGRVNIQNNRTFQFFTEAVAPGEDVTIAAGWPKGLVNRSAFWWQFLGVHYVFISSVLIVLATLLTMLLYWYFTEKRGKGRGTIIPEYEPPRKLPPAMAEVIVRERVTPKAWAATVIDLAVRGYVKINEDNEGLPIIVKYLLSAGAFLLPFAVIFILIFVSGNFSSFFYLAFVPLIFLITFFKKNVAGSKKIIPTDYVIESIKPFETDSSLHDYEKSFMSAVLGDRGRFSTREMRHDRIRGRELYLKMKKVEGILYKETEGDTNAYEKPIFKDKYSLIGIFLLFFFSVFMIPIGAGLSESGNGLVAIIIVFVLCALALILFMKFEARLSAEGAILREEWLGFKMYLETAEKYRAQAMTTPDLFEKYLPYAIIFGVEKKWGRAFEGISVAPPSWYHSHTVIVGNSISNSANNFSGGFSASAFSASFASSFTSAFSSSGGGGASGGGGGAGGGGGGGGGGAS